MYVEISIFYFATGCWAEYELSIKGNIQKNCGLQVLTFFGICQVQGWYTFRTLINNNKTLGQ